MRPFFHHFAVQQKSEIVLSLNARKRLCKLSTELNQEKRFYSTTITQNEVGSDAIDLQIAVSEFVISTNIAISFKGSLKWCKLVVHNV